MNALIQAVDLHEIVRPAPLHAWTRRAVELLAMAVGIVGGTVTMIALRLALYPNTAVAHDAAVAVTLGAALAVVLAFWLASRVHAAGGSPG